MITVVYLFYALKHDCFEDETVASVLGLMLAMAMDFYLLVY